MEQIPKLQEAIDTTEFDTETERMAESAPELQDNEPSVPDECSETNQSAVEETTPPTQEHEAFPARHPIDYRPEFCELVVALGKDGLSIPEIAVEIGISRDVLYHWMKAHEEFEYAMERANGAAQAYFERKGRDGIFMGKLFNGAQWQFIMRTRFPDDYGDAKDEDMTTTKTQYVLVTEDDLKL